MGRGEKGIEGKRGRKTDKRGKYIKVLTHS